MSSSLWIIIREAAVRWLSCEKPNLRGLNPHVCSVFVQRVCVPQKSDVITLSLWLWI